MIVDVVAIEVYPELNNLARTIEAHKERVLVIQLLACNSSLVSNFSANSELNAFTDLSWSCQSPWPQWQPTGFHRLL